MVTNHDHGNINSDTYIVPHDPLPSHQLNEQYQQLGQTTVELEATPPITIELNALQEATHNLLVHLANLPMDGKHKKCAILSGKGGRTNECL